MNKKETAIQILRGIGWSFSIILLVASILSLLYGVGVMTENIGLGLAIVVGSVIGLLFSVYFVCRLRGIHKEETRRILAKIIGWIIFISISMCVMLLFGWILQAYLIPIGTEVWEFASGLWGFFTAIGDILNFIS